MPRTFALVPAAGSGSRLAGTLPKQYLPLAHRPMLFHALQCLCGCARIERVYVVLAAVDARWPSHDWSAFGDRLRALPVGGATRAQSVRNGLHAMAGEVGDEDWCLVHDAARPLLPAAALERLLDEVGDDPVGGLLALPVADTLKRADGETRAAQTVERAGLWQAQTPQMFRYRLLLEALERDAAGAATDEAQAVEALGHRPLLVEGDPANFKVTFRRDLELARRLIGGASDEDWTGL